MRSAFLALLLIACSATAEEIGYPLMTLFRQEQHGGGTQNFDVARDPQGRLYFANGEGVLAYDGAWWSRIELPSPTAFNVAADRKGRIGVTSLDDIGVLTRGKGGTVTYRSLLPLVPQDLRSGMSQGDVCPAGDGLLFVTARFTATWDGTILRILDRRRLARGRRCAEIDGRSYVRTFEGLMQVGAGTTFAGRRVDAVVPGFVIVRNEGLFHFDETPYDTDASRWLRGKAVMAATPLRDGRMAIATLRNGLLVIQGDGTIDQIIDAAAGLPDVFLFNVEQDAEGSLWLAMDSGIVRLDFASPVTVFDHRLGLTGGVQTAARHEGKLYIGSTSGVFVLEPTAGVSQYRARRVPFPETNNPWSILSSYGDLLVGSYGGLLVLRDGQSPRLIDGTSEQIIYALTPSRRDPSRIWLGMEDGLATLRRDGDDWRYEGIVPNSALYVHSVIEMPDGTVWYGSGTDGAVRMLPNGTTARFGAGEGNVILAKDRLTIVTRAGFSQAGPIGKLVPDPILGHVHPRQAVFYAGADASGNLWTSTRPPSVIRRRADNTYDQEPHAIAAIDGDALFFFGDTDGVMWIGSERGLYRIEPLDDRSSAAQTTPAIHRIVRNGDRLLFDGQLPGATPPDELPHRFGRLRVEVAPLSYRAKTQYQYRLDPLDADWSAWTDQAFLDYTNLGANDYTFRVRTRGAAGATSAEAVWTFRVLAPWFATPWATALWIVLAALLVGFVIWIRTRTLRQRARQLQSRVDEQTVMLRRANEQLERLSLADPLTGVANRRAFDRGIAEAWKRAVRHDGGMAVIMLDLDHFKDLNDSKGHSAGDDCLRGVAQVLERAIRQNGDDLVARWGGEEFVVLLGATDTARALAVAERIREAIEPLGITASLGVAIRDDDATPIALIDRADRALYVAKHAGRNCVRLDERPSRA